jgi:hypothetical protein
MATRKHYLAQLIDESGTELEATTKYAMNSGIHASEALVRDLARQQETYFRGEHPQREGDVYTRRWTSDLGQLVTAKVSRTR